MIESARLINYSGKWYMVAWDLSCNDFRTFLISRIVRATLTKEPFAGGWGEERLKKHLSSGFGIFKSEDVTNAVIRFYHQVANIVSRQNWHSQQTTLNGSDEYGEYFEIKLPVGNFTELLGKVLRYGAKARIVLPTKLKKAWEKEIREMEKMIE
ncbi:MAG: hypothetical protein A2014_00405 [Spirochaetes bacterium GWF1_49_6]|nr:MAG: hypothetical protein A2014_00405 [Spirochaetes bacterium GWF1_49_6]